MPPPTVKGKEWQAIKLSDYGVRTYTDVIFTSGDTLKKNPELVKRYLRAVQKGMQYVIDHPDESVEILAKFPGQVEDARKLAWRFKLQNTLFQSDFSKKNGPLTMDPAVWTDMIAFLKDGEQIPKTVPVAEVTTATPAPDSPTFCESAPASVNSWSRSTIVAIADVAHYVRPATPLDHVARNRGNSVYFPDRAVPMLPFELSTNTFRSTSDGSWQRLTPETAVATQELLGADTQMVLDICAPLPSPPEVIRLAHERGFGPIDLADIDVSGDVTLEEAQQLARGFQVGLIRVEKYFEGTNISAYAGPPPESEKGDYCWGGCPGAIEEAIEILRLFDQHTDQKMPRMHVVFGNYRGPIPANPGEKVVFIGILAGILLSLNFSAVAQRESARYPLPVVGASADVILGGWVSRRSGFREGFPRSPEFKALLGPGEESRKFPKKTVVTFRRFT